MHIAVPAETDPGEGRVATTPDSVKKLVGLGATVAVEAGAGVKSGILDKDYEGAGAAVVPKGDAKLKDADVILRVRRPAKADVDGAKKGALVLAVMDPYGNEQALQELASAGVDAYAMELMPRITRAQSMDVLSSQANIAGYRAVVEAAVEYGRALPMMMTAAGTVPAAKAFIMGVGVAGLQAIATARRLGAIVTATDVRPATKEQVQSLGAKFVAVEDEEFKQAETSGGYAKEMSAEYLKKQNELVAAHIAKQDIVVTTALIPGRPAPKLISAAMVKSMRPGSVIIDLAVERGGNCELSKPGEVVEVDGVKIVGHLNVAGRLAATASSLYAKNLVSFLETMIDKKEKALAVKDDDELIKATRLTHGGKVVHPNFGGKTDEDGDAGKPAEATEAKPTEAKPTQTKPAQTKAAEPPSAETKPAETKPAETKPAETKPAETKPAETKPAVAKPAETKPAETKPAETKPAEIKPAEPEKSPEPKAKAPEPEKATVSPGDDQKSAASADGADTAKPTKKSSARSRASGATDTTAKPMSDDAPTMKPSAADASSEPKPDPAAPAPGSSNETKRD